MRRAVALFSVFNIIAVNNFERSPSGTGISVIENKEEGARKCLSCQR